MKTSAFRTITHIRNPRDQEAWQRPLDLTILRRLFGYTRKYRAKRNWLYVCVVLRSIQLPTLAWAMGAVINGPISAGNARGAVLGAMGFGLLAAVTQITLHFRQRLALELGENVVHDLRSEIFSQLLRMPMAYFHRTKVGRIISRMTSDVEAVRHGVQEVMFVTLVAGGQMVMAAAFMLWHDALLFLVVAALAPVLWAINRTFRDRFSRVTREVQESFSRVTATLAESVAGIRLTQSFVRQSLNAAIFRDLIADHSQYNLAVARTSGTFLPIIEFSSQFFIASLLAIGGYRVLSPQARMPIGDLVQFFFLAGIFFQPLTVLGNVYSNALTAMAGAERVFSVLDRQPEWSDPPDAVELPCMRGRVEFRNLSFGYNPRNPVLQDISLTAEPGQTVALVGHTGSGKSTLINLIAKFYLPTSGELLIDGVDIRRIRSDSLHRQMGIIQQQNFIFSGTVLENVRIGNPSATDDDIAEAARRLDCLDLLESLPDGLRTEVGERGTGLSLGQRQLVCFVRAMVANPRIIILDEATSSVDTMTEARIQKALQNLLKGRTCFVVAHRLSTIRNADVVLVLNKGRIIERGTHTELLRLDGLYANLYREFVRASEADAED